MNRRVLCVFSLLAFCFVSDSAAEGFRLYGMSAEGQMRGEALVASAQGPDANWYNPAALANSENKHEVLGGLNFLTVNEEYTSTTGQKVKNNDKYFPLPSLYYAQKMNDRWAMGIGVNTPFGLSTAYDNSAPFSYITTGGKVQLVNISPNAAFKVTDALSFGLGVNYYRSSAELRQMLPYSLAGGTDSPLKIEGDGDGVGLNTGLLVKLSDTQNVGVTYKSEVTIDYDGKNAHIDNVSPGNEPFDTGVKTRLRFPDMVGMGWSFQPSKRWDVEIGGQWTNWADMKKVDVAFENPLPGPAGPISETSTQFDWKNTWTARIGGTCALTDLWKISGGYFYTTTPTRESTYTPLVPDGNHHVFSVGGTYTKGPLTVGIPAVLILQTGSSSIHNNVSVGGQNVNGKYDLIAFQLGLSAGWRF